MKTAQAGNQGAVEGSDQGGRVTFLLLRQSFAFSTGF